MILIDKDGKSIVNTDQITTIYTGADGCSIKADFINGKSCQIGRYNCEREAREVIKLLSVNMSREAACKMPDDEFVRARIKQDEPNYHNVAGKKTKGHGGS